MSTSPTAPLSRPAWLTATGSIRGDVARGWAQVRSLTVDGWATLRHPSRLSRRDLLARWIVPGLLLFGVLGDAVTTSTIGFVAGISEANPVARHLMGLVGSPQLFTAGTVVVLAPLAVPLLGRPNGFVARATWLLLTAIPVGLKVYLTVANTIVLLTR